MTRPSISLLAVPFLLVGSLAAQGCDLGLDNGSDSIPPSERSLSQQLEVPRSFDVAPTSDDTGSVAYAAAVSLRDSTRTDLDLVILGGTIEVMAVGDQLFIQELLIDVGEFQVPASVIGPDGLDLTGISLRIAMPTSVDAIWSLDGSRVTTTQPIDIVIEWATRLESGEVYPLAPLRLKNLPLVLEVTATPTGLTTRVLIDRQGAFWRWLDTFELTDLSADIRASLF